MMSKVKEWIAIALAVAALIAATVSAMRDGELSAEEVAVLKEKAAEVVDAVAGQAQTAPEGSAE